MRCSTTLGIGLLELTGPLGKYPTWLDETGLHACRLWSVGSHKKRATEKQPYFGLGARSERTDMPSVSEACDDGRGLACPTYSHIWRCLPMVPRR